VITTTEVWKKFSNRKYRTAFARTQFKRLVPLQIQTLRRQRCWSQGELAERAGLTQGVISRAEDQDYGNLTVNTILSVADGFDVAFIGRFVPFSELDRWYVNLSQQTMRVPSFDEENAAMLVAEDQSTAITAAHGIGRGDERFGNFLVFEGGQQLSEPMFAAMTGKVQRFTGGLQYLSHTAKPDGGLDYAAVGGTTR
jgi:transcriptional regulator with XRE-family HTH domain